MISKKWQLAAAGLAATTVVACASMSIDNSAIGQAAFREHKATYGLVYKLPQEVNDELNAKIYMPLRPRLQFRSSGNSGRRRS